jgi:DNA-binding PadR family transcriptional regulator
MSVPYALLGLLEQGPSYGYDLKRAYDQRLGTTKPLPFGQVYSTLGRLERDRKVKAAGVESGEGRSDGATPSPAPG